MGRDLLFLQSLKSTLRARNSREWVVLLGVVLSGCALCAQTVPATQSIVTPERIAELEQKIAEAHGAADNGWMLVCAALWRAGPQKERSGHHDAELRHDGRDHGSLGPGRL